MSHPHFEAVLSTLRATAPQASAARAFRADYLASLRVLSNHSHDRRQRTRNSEPGWHGGHERRRYHHACQAVRRPLGELGLQAVVGVVCEDRHVADLAFSLGCEPGWLSSTVSSALTALAAYYAMADEAA